MTVAKPNPRDRLTMLGEPGESRPSQCNTCAHSRGDGATCRAFPKKPGIPYDVLVNKQDHRKAVKGDKGYRWSPADGTPHPNDVLAHPDNR